MNDSFANWLLLATDHEVTAELEEGFSRMSSSSLGIHITAHFRFEWFGSEGSPATTYREKNALVTLEVRVLWGKYDSSTGGTNHWDPLFFVRKGHSPDLSGCLFFLRELWPLPKWGHVDPSLSVEEWIVQDVMSS